MHWVASQAAGPVGPGWHPDPLDPARRLRWWDGAAWTARVVRLEVGSEAISWHHRLGEQPEPSPTPITPVSPAGADVPATPDAWAPAPPELQLVPPEGTARAHPRRNRRAWAMLGAAVLIIAVGAGAGTAMLGGSQRPTVEDTITYRDDAGDFALRYPTSWHLDTRKTGEQVRFSIGAREAPAGEQNTVSVAAGTSSGQPLPALDLLVGQTTEDLTAEHPGFRLVSAAEDRLADAPAFRLEFIDNTTRPSEQLVEVVGRTTSARPLIVVLTVREPRTAPTDEELRRFLASITSS